jgi:hypothetical protein
MRELDILYRGLRGVTYAWQFRPAVAAFGRSASLLDVKVSEFAAGGLVDADLVRAGVVWLPSPLFGDVLALPFPTTSTGLVGPTITTSRTTYVCESV